MSELEAVWHNDGHEIKVTLEQQHVHVALSECPNNHKPNTACYHEDVNGCVVDYFVELFGIECNVGTAPATNPLPIAWAYVGTSRNLEKTQVWIIPSNDDAFAAWFDDQTAKE